MAEAARRRGHAYQVLTDHTQIAGHRPRPRAGPGRGAARDHRRRSTPGSRRRRRPARRRRRRRPRASACSTAASSRSAPTACSTTRTTCWPASTSSSRRSTSSRRQPRAELTRRTLNAIRSPHVDVIAHPSGRMIGGRDDLDLDWDVVYAEAARTGHGARDERLAASARPRRRARAPRGRGRAASCRSTPTPTRPPSSTT